MPRWRELILFKNILIVRYDTIKALRPNLGRSLIYYKYSS